MNISKRFHSAVSRVCYNSSEVLASCIVYRRPPKSIKLEKNIKYGNGHRERMNLIYQKNHADKQPLLVYIHGGGFISGHVTMRNTYCAEYVKQGFFVANIDYEYAPKQIFPYQIQQCLTAIDKIYSLADAYNFDTSKIMLAGESAGAYFLVYLSVLASDHTLYDKVGLKFEHKDEFNVTAIVSLCGLYDVKHLASSKFSDIKIMIEAFTNMSRDELFDDKNSEKVALLCPKITKNFPPTMLIFGTHDELRFESYALHEQLLALGVPNKMYRCSGLISMHAFAIATCLKSGRKCLNSTLDFVLPYFDKTRVDYKNLIKNKTATATNSKPQTDAKVSTENKTVTATNSKPQTDAKVSTENKTATATNSKPQTDAKVATENKTTAENKNKNLQ